HPAQVQYPPPTAPLHGPPPQLAHGGLPGVAVPQPSPAPYRAPAPPEHELRGDEPRKPAPRGLRPGDAPNELRREIHKQLIEHLDLASMKNNQLDDPSMRPKVLSA